MAPPAASSPKLEAGALLCVLPVGRALLLEQLLVVVEELLLAGRVQLLEYGHDIGVGALTAAAIVPSARPYRLELDVEAFQVAQLLGGHSPTGLTDDVTGGTVASSVLYCAVDFLTGAPSGTSARYRRCNRFSAGACVGYLVAAVTQQAQSHQRRIQCHLA